MSRQGPILVLALLVWALMPELALWSGVLSYGLSWLAVNAIAVWKPTLLAFGAGRGIALGLLVVVVPISSLWSRRDELLENERLVGSLENASDRARLEATPSIFPPVVFADHPQTFYVHAPGGAEVTVGMGAEADRSTATSLGHGLHRFTYDPRRDGPPSRRDGPIQATIRVDGRAHERTLDAVLPRPHPRWLCGSRDRRLAAVPSEETDEIAIIGPSGLVARVDVGDGPSGCAFIDDRRVAVSHRYEPSLWIIDAPSGRTLHRVPLSPHQHRVAAAPDAETLAVATRGPEPGIFLVDADAGSVKDFVIAEVDWLAFGADSATLVTTTRRSARLERLRLTPSGARRSGLSLGRPAVTLAVSGDGRRAAVATTDYRADGSTHLGNHFVQDQLLFVDLEALTVTDQELTARRSSRQANAGDVDRGGSPMGIDLLDDGSARIAFAGTFELWTLGRGPGPTVVDTDELLSAPHSVFTFADGSFVATSPADGALAFFDPSGELSELVRLAPDDDALLAESERALARRMGERVFYESTRSGISCQSCHLHADTDHVLRNIGERRLSPTLSVRGVAGTAPYLRDGSYPKLSDLSHLSETLFRGFLRRVPGRGHTLEAFVEALPRTPSHGLFAERDLARERRGLEVFVDAGCPTCHAFPAFTNLGRHPLGALFPERPEALAADAVLDVPSLIGVGRGGPFLTDGRAASLDAVIRDHNEANRHGDTASLSDAEIDALVHFLEML